MIEAEIITIGDEILIGQIVDTNSAWMGRELNKNGIFIRQITSVSDKASEITRALDEAISRAQLILITGGLGPTKDDITKHTLAKYFDSELVISEPALENVKDIFSRFNRPFLDVNRRQAEVPSACTMLLNKQGTAPGMWFEKDETIIVSMPGVPHEMKYLMEAEVFPRLAVRFSLPYIYHYTLLTAGIGESFLANILAPVEDSLPGHIHLAYLPSLGQLRLRLSSQGSDEQKLNEETEAIVRHIRQLAGKYIVAEEDISLAQVIIQKLERKSKTIAVAESCTGGYLSSQLTSIAGSSKVFLGGMVVYSNALKQSILGIDPATIEEHGAVSEAVAQEMVLGALKTSGADYAISTTGIAGPGGGSIEKPVGLVFIGYGNREHIHVAKMQFGKERLINIERTAMQALFLLNRFADDESAMP